MYRFCRRPDFMQIFASKKVYMFFYGVIGIINVRQRFMISQYKESKSFFTNVGIKCKKVKISLHFSLQGMQYTYLSTMLSTLEKKFGIKSKETVMEEILFLSSYLAEIR